MYACMCVGGCILAASVWMCVWGGRRRRARTQLHALGRGQRDQPVRAPLLQMNSLCSTLDCEGERDEVKKKERSQGREGSGREGGGEDRSVSEV